MNLQLDLAARRQTPWVSPTEELGAYEALWAEPGTSFKTIADRLGRRGELLPTDLVEPARAMEFQQRALAKLSRLNRFGLRIQGAGDYPAKLRDADHPLALLYYRGWWDLVYSPSVAVVGTRQPSAEGIARTRRLVRHLVEDDYTVVSGLAAGVDTAAHTAAIEAGGRTIAVIGTPLTEVYPKENADLQDRIARDFLLISQVPVERWSAQTPRENRLFFPERNVTMSALTEATIIVEAGNTSGTLIQARHAIKQQRKLFILDSCFNNPELTWPHKYLERGAIRVRSYDDIKDRLTRKGNED